MKSAYKPRTKGEPVQNKDTGRTVYVNPETLDKRKQDFQDVNPADVGDPRWRGKAKPAKKPRKPDPPEIPRDPPPAPVHPSLAKRPEKESKPVTQAPKVKEVKHPDPSPKRKWKRLKDHTTPKAAAVVQRFLAASRTR